MVFQFGILACSLYFKPLSNMSFWWVNHKQTAAKEIGEGYIWSPKANKGGSRNEAYLNLKRVRPGEMIFSYANQTIGAIGIIESEAEDEPKPLSFGAAGARWDAEGWMVKVKWVRLKTAIRPKDFINEVAPLLPEKYSPLQISGNGNQGVYLTQIDSGLVDLLMRIITKADGDLPDELQEAENDVSDLEVEKQIIHSSLQKTERDQLIQARIGQGLFRGNVEKIECKVSGYWSF